MLRREEKSLITLQQHGLTIDTSKDKPLNSWENLAYEAVLDGNTAVVFVKGISHRQDKESDPKQFSCHFGFGDWKTGDKYMLTTRALMAAQEVVRCLLPRSILMHPDKALADISSHGSKPKKQVSLTVLCEQERMAHNRQPDLKPNHHSSSEDEEEEEEEASGSEDEQTSDSGSEEEVSDSDSEPKQTPEPKKPAIAPRQPVSKPQVPDLSSSETEESGSDTDSDSQSKKSAVADPNIKPISSKPMDREEGANLDSKSVRSSGAKAASIPSPAKAKRPPPALANEKDTKKSEEELANR
ncbi:hypothetical protein LXL04_033535 [Taraxacum kok-saghyz]